jgi:hypothetical protein
LALPSIQKRIRFDTKSLTKQHREFSKNVQSSILNQRFNSWNVVLSFALCARHFVCFLRLPYEACSLTLHLKRGSKMNVKGIMGALLLTGMLTAGSALADHDRPGQPGRPGHDPSDSVRALKMATQDLDMEVQESRLSIYVRRAVSEFASRVDDLYACTDDQFDPRDPRDPWDPRDPRDDDRDHDDGWRRPRECRHEMRAMEESWRDVDHYLRDSRRDAPRVYRIYVDVAELVDEVLNDSGPGPGPGPGRLTANGAINHYVFYFVERSRVELQRACVHFAWDNNIDSVRDLIVNGHQLQDGGWHMSVEEACSLVAQYAK